MKDRNFIEIIKNAAGTVFLLAAAFFVCSTFLSMRAVLADPVPQQQSAFYGNAPQSPRAGNQSQRAASTTVQGRTGGATVAPSRSVAGRANTASRAQGNTAVAPNRNVVSRTNANNTVSRTTAQSRSVVARTGVAGAVQSRVSLSGSAIRGNRNTNTSTYQYLSNKLYTGNYSNIIDPTTGLISSEAYSNCMESYYTCMDEICTARNAAQRRCACAGRVKAFADAELKLESANEELIKVSGELALLIATKGKDVSTAFQLTDAEKVMNCVSWQEANKDGTATDEEMKEWCSSHMIYDPAKCGKNRAPAYCSSTGNNFGFDITNLDGSGSDILSQLKSWADAKDKTVTITNSDNNALSFAMENLTGIVGGLTGGALDLNKDGTIKDSLAETWGYELFEYAHNNVCNRVLDSCFNGIYEACGTPPAEAKKCTNGSSVCPYNYNSYISVSNTGGYELNFVTPNTGYTSSNSATCFGYASTSGDPYRDLRGPVADARRSILQKYALDANADCDSYGDQLRRTAQNIGYQKVAAQQALQKKRLEFAQEEETTMVAALSGAKQNYLNCLDEIQQCRYDITQQYKNQGWTTTRIKSYCNTMTNVPSCYTEMVCDQQASELVTSDDATNSGNQKQQNIVSLAEILSSDKNTARGACLDGDMNVRAIRNFGSEDNSTEQCKPQNGTNGYKTWNASTNTWSECQATACDQGYHITTVGLNKVCMLPANATADASATTVGPFVPVVGARCNTGYVASAGTCISAACPTASVYDTACLLVAADDTVGGCAKIGCKCLSNTKSNGGLCIE